MEVTIYIKRNETDGYVALDLFKDEKVEINLNVKNLADISKVRSDFTQTFTIPTSPINNKVFEYWYNAEVDGTFNANIRVDAYIEVNSIPFRFGSIQLDNSKLKNGLPNSYAITFFGSAVNLSDAFGDDLLKDLPLSDYNHNYDISIMDATYLNSLNNGDVYYPLISSVTNYQVGTGNDNDITINLGNVVYTELKPALRLLRIIEAIEQKYNVSFSRDFFDRSIFYNLFIWLHNTSGKINSIGNKNYIDITSKGTLESAFTGVSVDLTNNTLSYGNGVWTILLKIIPAVGYESVNYNSFIEINGVEFAELTQVSGINSVIFQTLNSTAIDEIAKFKIQANEEFVFTSEIKLVKLGITGVATQSSQTITALIQINKIIPEIKVKDFFNSLVNQFNLIIKPTTSNSYYIDTLDNWYSKSKAYDITNLVDIKDITINKPKVKKKIDFLYQKAGNILGKKYFENNQRGYGDLKAVYDIQGDELKIESQFENLMFERLQNRSNGDVTNIHVGKSINETLQPYIGKPYIFYRNGTDDLTTTPIKVKNRFNDLVSIWHTATEDNIMLQQVTNSLNFGDDNSSYFFAPITTSLYYNFWKTYIEDLYNKKTRVLNLKCKLPIRILYNLGLNDRFIIGDKKYKISTIKVDLTTTDADIELFTDLSAPIDSYDNTILLTADTINYSADTTLLTADRVSIHQPVTSYVINGVSITTYNASKGEENFEVKIDANTDWNIVNTNSWITINKTNGVSSDYIRVKVSYNSGATRTGAFDVNIGSDTFTITIIQA